MRLLLIGEFGQLGSELLRTCSKLGDLFSVGFPEIDLTKGNDLRHLIQKIKPTLILNAAAYTNVDKAENEPELVYAVNAIAPAIMAEESKKINSAFIHYSTDYVFDGLKMAPYLETDNPKPLNAYGKSKLDGEKFIQQVDGSTIVLRTSWLYSLKKMDFVSKVLEWSRTQNEIRIVIDQVGSPTWVRMLAENTAQLIAQGLDNLPQFIKENSGLYHLSGSGFVSRYEWAQTILDMDPNQTEQITQTIKPALSSDFSSTAQRPIFSGLDCQKFTTQFGLVVPNWKETLSLALNTLVK